MNNFLGLVMHEGALDRAERREKYEGNLELATKDVENFEQMNLLFRVIHDVFDTEAYKNYCVAREFYQRVK